MAMSNFFAHNLLFENKRQYSKWILWRWVTAEDQNPLEISLSRCTEESVADCWKEWFIERGNTRINESDLTRVLGDIRRAVHFGRTEQFQVKPIEKKGSIYWPGIGYIDHSVEEPDNTVVNNISDI